MNTRTHLLSSNTGFTLIELLSVVTILAILIVIGIPFVGKAQLSGLQAQSTSNLRQLATANINYAADQGKFCPADDQFNNRRWHGARRSSSEAFDPTLGFLADYLGKSRKVNICPLFERLTQSSESFSLGTGGYGYNSSYVGGTPGIIWNADRTRKSAKITQVKLASTTVMFTTTAYARTDGIQEYAYSEPPFWDFGDGPTGFRPSPSVHFRFNGKALVAWCDGHVTAEKKNSTTSGSNPHGGNPDEFQIGWFGSDEENGYWNPARSQINP